MKSSFQFFAGESCSASLNHWNNIFGESELQSTAALVFQGDEKALAEFVSLSTKMKFIGAETDDTTRLVKAWNNLHDIEKQDLLNGSSKGQCAFARALRVNNLLAKAAVWYIKSGEQVVIQEAIKDFYFPEMRDGNPEARNALLLLWDHLTPEQQNALNQPPQSDAAATPSSSSQAGTSEPADLSRDLLSLELLYNEGKEATQDLPKALIFWETASKRGEAECSLKLAEHYRADPSQKSKMIEYYFEAYLQAHRKSQNEIMLNVYNNLLKLRVDSKIVDEDLHAVIEKLSEDGRSWETELNKICDLIETIEAFTSKNYYLYEHYRRELSICDDLESESSFLYEQSSYNYSSYNHTTKQILNL